MENTVSTDLVPIEGNRPKESSPSEARSVAVADLTMQAYQRASTLELTAEESALLIGDFPDEAFQPGAGGKKNLIYIEHAYLRDRLNQVFGPGKWAIVPRKRWPEPFEYVNDNGEMVEGTRVYVEAMLLARGCFVAEAIGDMVYYPKNLSQNYGDAVEGAKSEALRRCCKELGVGLQAWKKGWAEGWWKRKNNPSSTPAKPKQEPINGPVRHEKASAFVQTKGCISEEQCKSLARAITDAGMKDASAVFAEFGIAKLGMLREVAFDSCGRYIELAGLLRRAGLTDSDFLDDPAYKEIGKVSNLPITEFGRAKQRLNRYIAEQAQKRAQGAWPTEEVAAIASRIANAKD